MSTLKFEKLSIKGHRLGKASWFPAIRELIKSEISAKLDEDDNLFIGYGMMSDTLPYTLLDDYDTPEETLEFQAAILENKYLKAVFLPEVGGRLWSLYDKVNNRDLILENTRFILCNLGIRNAWFAGGVEFNCGRRGHDEQTVSPRFAAIVETPDYPVLRIYEYQRDRGTPFQYDCFLPDDSRFLYIRGRIVNPNDTVVPMYWWSNIAIAEVKNSRVVVPCQSVFANWYSGGSHALAKLSMPDGEGFDASYPEKFEYVKDHFYNIPEDTRRYECLFFPDGYGFCHVSTKRMRGRKLFVWGQSQGGTHWNKKLLGPNLDRYIELQGGLGRSQQECLPMPPKTAWEWLEGYGALPMEPEKVFGSWDDAVNNTTAVLDEIIPESQLEEMLKNTRESIALKEGKVIISGSGWAALEEMRTGEKLAPQLDFGQVTEEQSIWVDLLKNNRIESENIYSYLVSDSWFELLKNAKESWQKHYLLSLNYYRRQDLERSERELDLCDNKLNNRYTLHVLANIRRLQKRNDEAIKYITDAALLDLSDKSFIKEVLKMLLGLSAYSEMQLIIEKLDNAIAELPLIKMMKAFALAYTGELEAAEDILTKEITEIPDIREGENSTSQLYIYIKLQQALKKGIQLNPSEIDVPFHLDLRMSGN
jgi:tetratricopeptide (TPR) repeat protein